MPAQLQDPWQGQTAPALPPKGRSRLTLQGVQSASPGSLAGSVSTSTAPEPHNRMPMQGVTAPGFSPLAGSVSTSSAPNALKRMRRSKDMEAGMVSTLQRRRLRADVLVYYDGGQQHLRDVGPNRKFCKLQFQVCAQSLHHGEHPALVACHAGHNLSAAYSYWQVIGT